MRADEANSLYLSCFCDLISSSAQHGVRGSRQASERAAEDASGRSVGLIRSKRFLGSLVLFAHKDISHDSQYNFKKDLKPFFGYTWPKMLKFFEIESIKFVLRVM